MSFSETNPKQCECGERGLVIDSRLRRSLVFRRYECKCGKRWGSVEIRINDGFVMSKAEEQLVAYFGGMLKEQVADELIALAQKLLHGES